MISDEQVREVMAETGEDERTVRDLADAMACCAEEIDLENRAEAGEGGQLWYAGDVVSLGSQRLYDVTEVDTVDRLVRVWPKDEDDERHGQWLGWDHPKLRLVDRPDG